MEIRHEGEVHWDLKCRRCGRTICGRTGKREGGKTHRFAVYCDACAEVIARREEKVMTKYGEVRVKVSEGFGVTKVKPEYDDVSEAAEKE